MAITIIATVGASTSNSFVTEAEQIAYMAARLNASAWTTTSGTTCTENEKKAMIEATRELNAIAWDGWRVHTSQALAWPRFTAVDPDSTSDTKYYGTTTIPQRIKDATCELAFEFLRAGTTDIASLDESSAITTETVGPISTSYAPGSRAAGLARFPRVLRLIAPLLNVGAGQVRLVR